MDLHPLKKSSTQFLIKIEGLGNLTSNEHSISTQKLIDKKAEYTKHVFLSPLLTIGTNSKRITMK